MPVPQPSPPLDWKTYGLAFGDRLRQVRRAAGFTQEALAHRSGLQRNQIQNMENNRNNGGGPGNPTLQSVYRLAQALEVPAAAAPGPGPDVAGQDGVALDVEEWVHAARQAPTCEPRARAGSQGGPGVQGPDRSGIIAG